MCQQAEWRCEGSHSGQGGGWAGPHCSAGNENTTRPLQPLAACLLPSRVPTACPPPGPGRESRATGHRPGLNLAPAPWTRSWGPCTNRGWGKTDNEACARPPRAGLARSGPNLGLCPAHPTGGQGQSPGTSINGEWDGGLRALTYVTGIVTWALPASAPS